MAKKVYKLKDIILPANHSNGNYKDRWEAIRVIPKRGSNFIKPKRKKRR